MCKLLKRSITELQKNAETQLVLAGDARMSRFDGFIFQKIIFLLIVWKIERAERPEGDYAGSCRTNTKRNNIIFN